MQQPFRVRAEPGQSFCTKWTVTRIPIRIPFFFIVSVHSAARKLTACLVKATADRDVNYTIILAREYHAQELETVNCRLQCTGVLKTCGTRHGQKQPQAAAAADGSLPGGLRRAYHLKHDCTGEVLSER